MAVKGIAPPAAPIGAEIGKMQTYLFIGGGHDGLTHPAPDSAEILQWPVGITGREIYNRATLSLAGVSVEVYIHESLTPEQALDLLIGHYKAWCVNRPGGRR